MKKTKMPDPHKPLTRAEWEALGPVMHGIDELPPAAQAAVRRMGRPPVAIPKQPVKLRIDADTLAMLRALGKGWQTRVNAALREWVATQPLAEKP